MASARCAFCNQALPSAGLTSAGGVVSCRLCGRRSTLAIFPALMEDAAPKPPVLPHDPPGEGEAACFYSPGRRATKECSHCGVLISDLWAAQWGTKTVCLKCLEHLREKGRDDRFNTSRTLWDNLTLLLALAPLLLLPLVIFYWIGIFTAPAALFVGLWHWNSPRTMVPRGRWRLVLGLLLAGAQVAAGIYFVAALWFGWFR